MPPLGLSRPLVERCQELIVGPIACENQHVFVKNRRTGRALERVVLELGVRPYDLACRIQAHRAARSEMDVDVRAVQHRCRRGVAVGLMPRTRVVSLQHLDIVKQSPTRLVEADGVERFSRIQRTGHPNLVSLDHRRRPALARDSRFPGDVLLLAPVDWETLLIRVPLAVRPAELRPIC